jgi:adenylyltransferase/sulfurtransferase
MWMDERFSRQIAFKALGEQGQARLRDSSVLVAGCGGLGAASANALVRAGVGRVRIADRDVVEESNLHRQILYDEEDAASSEHKVEIAARKLRRVYSDAQIESRALEISAANIEELIAGVDLVVDGTDNMSTRYLINEACVRSGTPWVYAGIHGATGMTMNILPGEGPCLSCLFPDSEERRSALRGAPVLGPTPAVAASIQAMEAIKILAGAEPSRALLSFDLWAGHWQVIQVARDADCPTCVHRRFDRLRPTDG